MEPGSWTDCRLPQPERSTGTRETELSQSAIWMARSRRPGQRRGAKSPAKSQIAHWIPLRRYRSHHGDHDSDHESGDGTRTVTRENAEGTLLSTELRGVPNQQDAESEHESPQNEGPQTNPPSNHIEPEHENEILGGGSQLGGSATDDTSNQTDDHEDPSGDGDSDNREDLGPEELLPPSNHIEPEHVDRLFGGGDLLQDETPTDDGDDETNVDSDEEDDSETSPELEALQAEKDFLDERLQEIDQRIKQREQTRDEALDFLSDLRAAEDPDAHRIQVVEQVLEQNLASIEQLTAERQELVSEQEAICVLLEGEAIRVATDAVIEDLLAEEAAALATSDPVESPAGSSIDSEPELSPEDQSMLCCVRMPQRMK